MGVDMENKALFDLWHVKELAENGEGVTDSQALQAISEFSLYTPLNQLGFAVYVTLFSRFMKFANIPDHLSIEAHLLHLNTVLGEKYIADKIDEMKRNMTKKGYKSWTKKHITM